LLKKIPLVQNKTPNCPKSPSSTVFKNILMTSVHWKWKFRTENWKWENEDSYLLLYQDGNNFLKCGLIKCDGVKLKKLDQKISWKLWIRTDNFKYFSRAKLPIIFSKNPLTFFRFCKSRKKKLVDTFKNHIKLFKSVDFELIKEKKYWFQNQFGGYLVFY
jgi:hypothetical protein